MVYYHRMSIKKENMFKKRFTIIFMLSLLSLSFPYQATALLTVGSTSITSDGALTMNAVANTADAIYLHANGGTSETIKLHADQGTGVDSINLLSDVGGLTLQSGLASADAINITATAGALDLDSVTGLTVNVSSATAPTNITVAVDADAEDLTISTTGSAGDLFLTSADDLTLTGSPIALSSTGSIAVTGNMSFTNGAVVYNDSGDGDGDCSAGTYTVTLSQGNFFNLTGDDNGNCTLSFSGGATGGIYMLQLNWSGPYDFILSSTGGVNRTIEQNCANPTATADDNGDIAILTIRMFSSNTPIMVSCTVIHE